MKKKLTGMLLLAVTLFAACKKSTVTMDEDPTGKTIIAKTTTKTNVKEIPQKALGLSGAGLERLIKQFKHAAQNNGAGTARLNDLPPEMDPDYAISILEATLNYDFDEPCTEDYETSVTEKEIAIPLNAGGTLSSNTVEGIYTDLTNWVQEQIGSAIRPQAIDISGGINDNGEIVFTASALLFNKLKYNPCGNMPPGYYYAVPAAIWYLGLPCAPQYNTDVLAALNGRLNCLKMNFYTICPEAYYFFPVSNLFADGNPNFNTNTFYSTGYNLNSWFCSGAGVISNQMADAYRSNLNALAATPALKPPGYYILNKFVQGIASTHPNPMFASSYRSVYWRLWVMSGQINCYIMNQ